MKVKNKYLQLNRKNQNFIDSNELNVLTYYDYLNRFEKVARNVFEWINLPKSMNADYLEKCLYYYGQASIIKDKTFGFINLKASDSGEINIYDLPTKLHCYSNNFETNRKLYVSSEGLTEEQRKAKETQECILVRNTWDRIPTYGTMNLFALRLYEAERTSDTNLKAQKTPIMLVVDEKQRLLMENLYNQYNGNMPFIFGDKLQLDKGLIQAIKTDAPFLLDKLQDYKKEIWNEALTFLGINNIMIDKKERLITDEANSNNELINLNLQSFLAPRKEACKQFNEKFGLKGTEKEIDVRVRSDLHNVIKNVESTVSDYKELEDLIDDKTNESVVKE